MTVEATGFIAASTTRCRACGGEAIVDLGPCADFPKDGAHALGGAGPGRLVRCASCHFAQREPTPADDVLADAYEQTPASDMEYAYEQNLAWVRGRALLLERFPDGPVQVCDVGCHRGDFLAGLPERFGRHGVESSVEGRARAAGHHGVRLIGQRIEDVGEQWSGAFDVITLFDVFEHLVRPVEELECLVSWLRPGGTLCLSTGDLDTAIWRIAAGHHWYLQTPLHVSIGSRAFFEGLADTLPLVLDTVTRIAHQGAPVGARLRQWLEFAHWQSLRRGGIFRLPQRILQALPGLRGLAHRQNVPWTTALPDHAVFVFTRR